MDINYGSITKVAEEYGIIMVQICFVKPLI